MNTGSLKSFATKARLDLIKGVRARLSVVLAENSIARVESRDAIRALERAIGNYGREGVVDRVAYTWFNRIIALRFMDANAYTPSAVVSPEAGRVTGQPEILAEAKSGTFDPDIVPPKTAAKVTAFLNGTTPSSDPQGEAYGLLLEAYCRHWNKALPFMFEREGDYTELLIPSALLAADSVRAQAVETLTRGVCEDVEVIGWLYQFYISERKDEVFAGFKKNKKAGADEIPAATQLFTPHWIVRYLVENSLGRLWMLNNPTSSLVDQMEHYIAPVDDDTDFLKISGPEELKVVDPACGSGHMLTYAFDLLYSIYEEQGYTPSEIPGLILSHNLYGIEIDPRAGALAAFALTMKAAARRKLFLKKPVAPNVRVLEPVKFTSDELDLLRPPTIGRVKRSRGTETLDLFDPTRDEIDGFWNQFQHADTFGSLIRPDADLIAPLRTHVETLEDDILGAAELREAAENVLDQAEYLTQRYHVAIANPPYMGGKQMNPLLSQFMKNEYPDSKSDLFAGFIERCTGLALPHGAAAMITMQSWMFLSSYEKLRSSLLANQWITSMLHLGARAFDSVGGEVVSSTAFVLTNLPSESRNQAGSFIRLVDGNSESEKARALSAALSERTTDAGFHLASGDDFADVPGSPIVYWLSEKMRAVFTTGARLGTVASLAVGLQTGDNNRFLRQWWEVSGVRTAFSCTSREDAAASGARWFPYNKGGEFRKWYGNQDYVLNWENDGAEIVDFKPRSVIRNPKTYFSPSVSWSDISSGEAAFRRYPAGFVHDSTGHSGFGGHAVLDQISLLLNSRYVMEVMQVLAPTMHFHIGYVGLVPVADGVRALATSAVDDLVETSREDWDISETSWNFAQDPLVALA
ncbi:BREX-1 system adenine-specific DNA-methyltransferase PglX [Luteimicrobium subarcticum]|uniref:site-specific DNA-methyltransferase (adenine-specific) n=1 Tax=Luteimicrobium subarcticum TaxID=620910 RepID=A0A2M8WRN8_9MICO|nr:BREX-1 system adenine-specific DNA-methyltransferase PglX [Luteimicrobium subarcticum]PJI93568.1 Eco57I restriction-modification methylase [Luteimicrobium subarcticum]